MDNDLKDLLEVINVAINGSKFCEANLKCDNCKLKIICNGIEELDKTIEYK